MRIGIIGVKFTGKTTLFNAITGQRLPTGQGGVEVHLAAAQVPDQRLARLAALFRPRRTVPAQVEWVDIPGLDLSAPCGGREAARLLEHARRADALVHVVRGFGGGLGDPAPLAELTALDAELALADLQIVENRLGRLTKDRLKLGKQFSMAEPQLLESLRAHLEAGRPLRDLGLDSEQEKLVSGFSFLTRKPLLTVVNAEEQGLDGEVLRAAQERRQEVIPLCAQLEAEIAQLPEDERLEFLTGLGIGEPALHRLIRAAYTALGLQSFFTVGEDECRAWTVRVGALAPEAAGVVHSDMARGFIRAEVCAYEDLVKAGGLAAAKRENLLRLEGKHYVLRDGDILTIRFAV